MRVIPGWVSSYERAWLGPDAVAGLIVWSVVTPQCVAYAKIAGLPPEAGLMAAPAALALITAAVLVGAGLLHLGAITDLIPRLRSLIDHLGGVHAQTLAVGAGSLALLVALKRFVPRVPGTLVVLVLAIATSALLQPRTYSPIPGEAASPPMVGQSQSVATSYEIRIRGKVGSSALASFEDMEAAIRPAETVLRGEVTDQAQLHGLLERIQLLGLELIEIRRVSPTDAHETGT